MYVRVVDLAEILPESTDQGDVERIGSTSRRTCS